MGPGLPPLILLALLAAPPAPGAAASRPVSRAGGAATRKEGPRLAEARAALRALMRDPRKRRFHDQWDRAIKALQTAARGADAATGTLEAARARYALYRWSADEADRDEALRLATSASRLGAREAASFAAAVRREAGDDRPAVPVKPVRPVAGAHPAAAPRPAPAAPATNEEAPPDPQLEAAVAELTTPAPDLALGESLGDGPASITGVKSWANDDYTRVAIYLDHWVGWQKLELPAKDGAPRRLALDLKPARLEGAALARAIEGDRVDRVRAAQHDAETVRVVLDLAGTDAVHFYGLEDPPRLIVDIGTRAAIRDARVAAAAAGHARPPHEGPEGATATSEGGELRPIRRVVVDAGHGGADPGAIGPTRVKEKDVTLAISKRLAARLKAAGYEVVMTRSDDRYVALEERTAIANTRRGDLFISIHANAFPRRSWTGTETWVLNVADDRYAKRLAARENGADLDERGEPTEAQRILTDLDARASTEASRGLAHLVQRELTGAVRTRFGECKDLGVKSALFYVLLGARMPAVLVETAFISNRTEEQRLANPAYQDEVAASVARAVDQFARHDPRVARAGGAGSAGD
jgi:N-acetylmuramoyl-L-alanine amidase